MSLISKYNNTNLDKIKRSIPKFCLDFGSIQHGHTELVDHLIWVCHSTDVGNPITEIRRSYERCISTTGFPTPVRRYHYIELMPRWCLLVAHPHKPVLFCSYPEHGFVILIMSILELILQKRKNISIVDIYEMQEFINVLVLGETYMHWWTG